MTDLQAAKAVLRSLHASLRGAAAGDTAGILARACTPDLLWRGMHPWNELRGPEAVAAAFWDPLLAAFTALRRREDLFLAGENRLAAGGTWVVSMGHLVGLHDAPFLGIPPTGRMAFLRYAEFARVEDGRIADTAFFCDLLHLMMQAGVWPLPPQTGAHLVQPGPETHDGLLHGPQDPEEGAATLAAIERMIGDLRTWQRAVPIEEELRRSWAEDMIWWGPAGIGATCTIPRYARQHAGPFRAAFRDRRPNGHVARVAEGHFGGFFGWPSLTLTHTGGFMGLPGSGRPADMRVVDLYRREGDLLAENWVFIDLLHFLMQEGVDVLARMETLTRGCR